MSQRRLASTTSTKSVKAPSQAVKYYLVAYNALSAIGWTYVLLSLLLHLSNLSPSIPTASQTASSTLSRLVAQISIPLPILKKSASPIHTHLSYFPRALVPLVQRAGTAYAAVGVATAAVQTLALLEVVHAAVGLVASPVLTTALQVASRLFAVWGVVEVYEVTRTSPIYATMVLAWSLTEAIRYPFYALSLLNHKPWPLLYLRYTTFYVLYPLGAFSEAYLNFRTLPKSSPMPSLRSWAYGTVWTPYDLFRGVMLAVWPPALFMLYTYMINQRRKVLGTGRTLSAKPKAKAQ